MTFSHVYEHLHCASCGENRLGMLLPSTAGQQSYRALVMRCAEISQIWLQVGPVMDLALLDVEKGLRHFHQ